MSKTLENLVAKANRKGVAVLNGRQREWGGYVGQLEEKYKIKMNNSKVELYHWGTKTLEIDTDKKEVSHVYGISNSDRDSINYMLNKFSLPFHTHYYPSKDKFELHDSRTDEVMISI